MVPIKSIDIVSLLRALLFNLAEGIFFMAFFYLVDWKFNEVRPYEHYILLALLYAFFTLIVSTAIYMYNNRKKEKH